MSQIATFQEFHDYFAAIAESHTDITAFRFGEKEVVQCASRSNLPERTLWVETYDPVQITDRLSDNHNGLIISSMVILAPMPKKWADQRAIYCTLEGIAKDIIAKVIYDWNGGRLQAEFSGWKYGWAEMMLGSTEMIGCRIDFTLMRPERLVYNETKWI